MSGLSPRSRTETVSQMDQPILIQIIKSNEKNHRKSDKTKTRLQSDSEIRKLRCKVKHEHALLQETKTAIAIRTCKNIDSSPPKPQTPCWEPILVLCRYQLNNTEVLPEGGLPHLVAVVSVISSRLSSVLNVLLWNMNKTGKTYKYQKLTFNSLGEVKYRR